MSKEKTLERSRAQMALHSLPPLITGERDLEKFRNNAEDATDALYLLLDRGERKRLCNPSSIDPLAIVLNFKDEDRGGDSGRKRRTLSNPRSSIQLRATALICLSFQRWIITCIQFQLGGHSMAHRYEPRRACISLYADVKLPSKPIEFFSTFSLQSLTDWRESFMS